MALLLVRVPLSARVGRQDRTGPDQRSMETDSELGYELEMACMRKKLTASLVMCRNRWDWGARISLNMGRRERSHRRLIPSRKVIDQYAIQYSFHSKATADTAAT